MRDLRGHKQAVQALIKPPRVRLAEVRDDRDKRDLASVFQVARCGPGRRLEDGMHGHDHVRSLLWRQKKEKEKREERR